MTVCVHQSRHDDMVPKIYVFNAFQGISLFAWHQRVDHALLHHNAVRRKDFFRPGDRDNCVGMNDKIC